ncbi:MAG: SEC-C domain-containing protein, partial [Rhodospirillales bacterium]|nr:SEC-C domain-containing protein [Rhodospirillales bacterium]
VMNDQRKVIYEQRLELMAADEVSETTTDMRHEVVEEKVQQFIPPKAYPEQWNAEGLAAEIERTFDVQLPVSEWADEEGITDEEVLHRVTGATDRKMAERAANFGPEVMRMLEKNMLLNVLDQHWKEHLLHLDHLRQVIGLRAYGQRDPLNEYKTEAFGMFAAMLESLRETVTFRLAHVQVRYQEDDIPPLPPEPDPALLHETHVDPLTGTNQIEGEELEIVTPGPAIRRNPAPKFDPNDSSTWGRVPRNSPCPCASGKKYKHCHG